ncbi:hypothetical protein D3C81_1188990 [compost metagenome]
MVFLRGDLFRFVVGVGLFFGRGDQQITVGAHADITLGADLTADHRQIPTGINGKIASGRGSRTDLMNAAGGGTGKRGIIALRRNDARVAPRLDHGIAPTDQCTAGADEVAAGTGFQIIAGLDA